MCIKDRGKHFELWRFLPWLRSLRAMAVSHVCHGRLHVDIPACMFDVLSLVIHHTENTEGYTIVSNNENKRNGRKAWVELSSHFEGSTFKEWVAQEAATTLKHASYSGPKRNFNFRYYCTLHTRAYAKLLRVDNPMTVEQQIDGFILGHPMCNCSKYSN